jgi:RimJ/RimL family protein N-acetyltransferase
MVDSQNTKETDIEFDVFLQGKLIDLVALNKEIVEKTNWYKWFNDEELTHQMQQHYFPNTMNRQVAYFKENIENSRKKLQCGIVHKRRKIMIGIVSLNDIDYLHRRCDIAGIIGEKEYQTLKYVIEAFQLVIKHAFEQLNMHKIYGGTIIKEVADMFVKILGFEKEGIKRNEVYKNGEYHDVYLLGLLRKDYYAQMRSEKQ